MSIVQNPVVQASEVIAEYGGKLSAEAIRERLTRHYVEHGEWPKPGGLAVDVVGYVRDQDNEGGSWDG